MLNEFTPYTGNLDATKNDTTNKVAERGYYPNGANIGRVGGSLPMPPSSSWNYPYLSNLYNYYNPNSYDLGNVHQYDNQKCGTQYARNYGEPTPAPRFHSTSVLQCCDPRCQLLAKPSKYSYHPLNTKPGQRIGGKRAKNYCGSIIDSSKPDASVGAVGSAVPPIEHAKYTPCVPYPTLRNDLGSKYSSQQTEYCSPFANTIKRGTSSSGFGEYYTDIGDPSYWNKNNTSIWNRNSTNSYYPPTFEEKNSQKIEQGNLVGSSGRGILFNRLLERDRTYDAGFVPNYHYGTKNELNPNLNYSQPCLQHEPVVSENHLLMQPNSYQPTTAYNVHYPTCEPVPQYFKETTPKRAPNENHETRILDRNPNLDVREFLSTWDDDVDDEKAADGTSESPVIVLDCSNLEGDVLAKVKEKLNENVIINDDHTPILKIVDVGNGSSAGIATTTVLSPHTSVIQENASQSKEIASDKLESSHMNSDGCMTWYSNGKKKEDFSYDLVEMTERLVNTVGKLLGDPEKKAKPSISPAPTSESPSTVQSIDSHQLDKPTPPSSAPPQLVQSPSEWNSNYDYRRSKYVPPAVVTQTENVPAPPVDVLHSSYNTGFDEGQQLEKNVSCTFNLYKTSNDLKFSVNYSAQQNDYSLRKMPDSYSKFKTSDFVQPYHNYWKNHTNSVPDTGSYYKNYTNYSSYYESAGVGYDQTKICGSNYGTESRDGTMNYVDHIDKHMVNDTDITLVKADLEKSLNEITHQYRQGDDKEDSQQYFESSCPETTTKCVLKSLSVEKNDVTESQAYNGVIQKTGICSSPQPKVDDSFYGENNILSMPSLSPPPLSPPPPPPLSPPPLPPPPSPLPPPPPPSVSVDSPLPVPQENERSLCGLNLTLNDVYENDVIFSSSQETGSNDYASFCSKDRISTEQNYQPLNLAPSRCIKSPISDSKDAHAISVNDDSGKGVDNSTSRADDGYYSIENAETDEIITKSISKQTSSCPASVAYLSCIVSHEHAKQGNTFSNDGSSLETQYEIKSPHPEPLGHAVIFNQSPEKNESCNTDIRRDDTLGQNKLTEFPEISTSSTHLPDEIEPVDPSVFPVLSDNIVADENIHHKNSNLVKSVDEKCDTVSLHPELESENAYNTVKIPETEITEKERNCKLTDNKSDLEEIVLNLKVGAKTSNCPTPCDSVIKENENFVRSMSKENSNSQPIQDNSLTDIESTIVEDTPELSVQQKISVFNMQMLPSPKMAQELPVIENSCLLDESNVETRPLKHKLACGSVKNADLPMKKRKSQDYLTKDLDLTITFPSMSTAVSDAANSVKCSFLTDSSHNDDNNKQSFENLPRKNKKKRKKDKSKINFKRKKFSKLKKHPSSTDCSNYSRDCLLNDVLPIKHRSLSPLSPENYGELRRVSPPPVYDDDMYNIPSIAPTPQCDLTRDEFESAKEQLEHKPSYGTSPTNLNLNSSDCERMEFLNPSTDLQMYKAPSPNCILQDDGFSNDKMSMKAQSPFYDLGCVAASPSSVAPSPNYDIIEGVLFDDTDWYRINEDMNRKCDQDGQVDKFNRHSDLKNRSNAFIRSARHDIDNEYESDYEDNRYRYKRKRNGRLKNSTAKYGNNQELTYRGNKITDNYGNKCSISPKFSKHSFRHFDYAVDDERFTRSEDDEYEPRPNHARNILKSIFGTDHSKIMKDVGKYRKKNGEVKFDHNEEESFDLNCDQPSNYISDNAVHSTCSAASPICQPSADLSDQCIDSSSNSKKFKNTCTSLSHSSEYFNNNRVLSEENQINENSTSLTWKNYSDHGGVSDLDDDNGPSSPISTVNGATSRSSLIESDLDDMKITNLSKTGYYENASYREQLLNYQHAEDFTDLHNGKHYITENHQPLIVDQVNSQNSIKCDFTYQKNELTAYLNAEKKVLSGSSSCDAVISGNPSVLNHIVGRCVSSSSDSKCDINNTNLSTPDVPVTIVQSPESIDNVNHIIQLDLGVSDNAVNSPNPIEYADNNHTVQSDPGISEKCAPSPSSFKLDYNDCMSQPISDGNDKIVPSPNSCECGGILYNNQSTPNLDEELIHLPSGSNSCIINPENQLPCDLHEETVCSTKSIEFNGINSTNQLIPNTCKKVIHLRTNSDCDNLNHANQLSVAQFSETIESPTANECFVISRNNNHSIPQPEDEKLVQNDGYCNTIHENQPVLHQLDETSANSPNDGENCVADFTNYCDSFVEDECNPINSDIQSSPKPYDESSIGLPNECQSNVTSDKNQFHFIQTVERGIQLTSDNKCYIGDEKQESVEEVDEEINNHLSNVKENDEVETSLCLDDSNKVRRSSSVGSQCHVDGNQEQFGLHLKEVESVNNHSDCQPDGTNFKCKLLHNNDLQTTNSCFTNQNDIIPSQSHSVFNLNGGQDTSICKEDTCHTINQEESLVHGLKQSESILFPSSSDCSIFSKDKSTEESEILENVQSTDCRECSSMVNENQKDDEKNQSTAINSSINSINESAVVNCVNSCSQGAFTDDDGKSVTLFLADCDHERYSHRSAYYSRDDEVDNSAEVNECDTSNQHTTLVRDENCLNNKLLDTGESTPETTVHSSILDASNAITESAVVHSTPHECIYSPLHDNLTNSKSYYDNVHSKGSKSSSTSIISAVDQSSNSHYLPTMDYCHESDTPLSAVNNSDAANTVEVAKSLSITVNVEASADIAKDSIQELPNDADSCSSNDVPTLRSLAIKALSKATINNGLLEVRETPERTEIIIHPENSCNSSDVILENVIDSGNLIMTDAFDDEPHNSPNFDAIKEMTFDYPVLSESSSSAVEEKIDEDLPCQCLIISSEESILCLRCSLNSSVVNQFNEMDDPCEVLVASTSAAPSDFHCVNGDCIEQSFIDQEIDFTSSSNSTASLPVNSSPSPPVVESTRESAAPQESQIKVQLPWHRIFNLGEVNGSDDAEGSSAGEQRILELGPAQVEVRLSSDELCMWKNANVSGSSLPVVKVKRLVVQRAVATAGVAAEKSEPVAMVEGEKEVAAAAPVLKKRGPARKQRKNLLGGRCKLDEIIGVPKMVIKKTSCRQYKSFLCTSRVLQPVIRLVKDKRLDELALRYHGGDNGVDTRVAAEEIGSNAVENDVAAETSLEPTCCEKTQKLDASKPVDHLNHCGQNDVHNEVKNDINDMKSGVDEDELFSSDSQTQAVECVAENADEKLSSCPTDSNNLLGEVPTNLAAPKPEFHHCMLCHRSCASLEAYKLHVRSRFHRHLELIQRKTIHALYRRFTGRLCPGLRPLSAKERKRMKWKPRNANINHFYHRKTPLQVALHKSVFHGRNNRSG